MISLENPSFNNVEAFCRTYEGNSFTAAARALGVTPQSASRAVARLEAHLGVTLFRRTTRALQPTEDGRAFARSACLELIAVMKDKLGSLDRVERVVKLGAFVNSTADFTDQPKVANGASELMVAVFGDAGKHARSAVGVPSLPLGVAVEVDAIVAVRAD